MSEIKKEKRDPKFLKVNQGPSWKLALPFFAVMAVLTVVAFIIPLRPAVSYKEKRELTQFPEFSVNDLLTGDYFDDITLWFSDTFPGRETWITISDGTKALHGYSEISIVEDNFLDEILNPHATQATTGAVIEAPPTETNPAVIPTEDPETGESKPVDATVPSEAETTPPETQWGGLEVGDDAEISMGAVIQIGDSAFNQLGFSSYMSDRYSKAVSNLADALAEVGVKVVSAPPPTSVGIMIEPEYQEKVNCARQDEMLKYLHDRMSGNVIKVDTYSALIEHNDEYIYFRTDHHWTALGAYYAYVAVCEALDLEPASLEDFEEVDVGEFRGSLCGKARYPQKLRSDNVYAYDPPGDISMFARYEYNSVEMPVLQDMTNRTIFEGYLVFMGGDYPLQEIINDSIPDAGNCLVVKDSFGNCFVPFLSQNFHSVYCLDYRTALSMPLRDVVEKYDIDTVIIMPYLMATQGNDGALMFEHLCR